MMQMLTLTGEEMARLDAVHQAAREIVAHLKALNACECEGAGCAQCQIYLRLLRGIVGEVTVTSPARLHEARVRVRKQALEEVASRVVAS